MLCAVDRIERAESPVLSRGQVREARHTQIREFLEKAAGEQSGLTAQQLAHRVDYLLNLAALKKN
jgi:hypothetical protein